jgi:GrpB-like predicted nucleotidyltransferase (UPF0157 family)
MKKSIAVRVHIDFERPPDMPTDPVELDEYLETRPELVERLLRAYRKAHRQALSEAQRNGAKKNSRTKAATRNRKVS